MSSWTGPYKEDPKARIKGLFLGLVIGGIIVLGFAILIFGL